MVLKCLKLKNPKLERVIVINPQHEGASRAELWTEIEPTWYSSLAAYLANV
jgi:hypothetical protein